MYKYCITEQSAQRQREMEAGLLALMATHRYEDITISELCEALNIPRKSFYRYFSSKDGALYALIDHTLMNFTDDFLADGINGLQSTQDTMEHYFHFWLEHKALLDALERSSLSGVLIQRTIALATSEDSYAQRISPPYSKRIKDYVIMFRVSGLMSLIIQWHNTNYFDHPREMAAIATRLLTSPLATSAQKDI